MKRMIFLTLFIFFCNTIQIPADVFVKQDGDMITVKNELLTFSIDLSRGARIGSYIYKGFNDEELIHDYKLSNGGMFKDLWTIQGWPGEMNKRRYKAEIIKSGPEKVIVKTWTISTGLYGGQKKEDIADILIEKTFSLKKGERILTVDYAFTNKGTSGKRPGFWQQSVVKFDHKKKAGWIYFRPTRFGVDRLIEKGDFKAKTENGYWHNVPAIAGWCGIAEPKLKRGVMFLMDYNYLKQLYNCPPASTVEWMYEDVAIPADKTWKTRAQLIPTENYRGYVYADANLIADFQPVMTPAGLKITHTLSASTLPLKDIVLKTEVCGAISKWSAKAEPLKFKEVGFEASVKTCDIGGIGGYPCVIKVDIEGKDYSNRSISIHYENYFNGTAGRNMDEVQLEPIYKFKIPEKQKQYLKPNLIKLTKNKIPRILFVRGLWANYNGIDDAIKQMGKVEVVDAWMKKTGLGETLGNFPGSYEVLLGYDLIILGNVSGPMLSSVGQEMLVDFVKAGGGLLMLGGDRTYGQTEFSNKNFANLLPVEFNKYGDYSRLKKSSALKTVNEHPVTKNISFNGSEIILYSHNLKAKKNAKTVLELGNNLPAVILSGNNKERVAVVSILPFGEAPEGRKLYRESKEWQNFMANIMKWLMNKKLN
jgi:uncharacterized membrane protein